MGTRIDAPFAALSTRRLFQGVAGAEDSVDANELSAWAEARESIEWAKTYTSRQSQHRFCERPLDCVDGR